MRSGNCSLGNQVKNPKVPDDAHCPTRSKKRLAVSISLFVMAIYTYAIEARQKTRDLNIIAKFPTEEQMLEKNFALGRGIKFDIFADRLYFCSQFEGKIFVFNLDGNYLNSIGKHGQGPGDFLNPLNIFVDEGNIYVSDNGNARIQILSVDGSIQRQIKIVNVMHGFVVVNDKLFILAYDGRRSSMGDLEYIFKIFNMNGELLRNVGGDYKSQYNDYIYDNSLTMRRVNNTVHCLQQFGVTYRIYSEEGELQREFSLKKNPLKDPEYKKIGYKWAYKTFCVDEDKIYATHVAQGRIVIDVFDMSGEYLCSYVAAQDTSDLYDISDMKITRRNGTKYLYLLVTDPDIYFNVAQIN